MPLIKNGIAPKLQNLLVSVLVEVKYSFVEPFFLNGNRTYSLGADYSEYAGCGSSSYSNS